MTKEDIINALKLAQDDGNEVRFAALVAAAEREACAKVCEDSMVYAGDTLAQAIRARGVKHG